MPIVNGEFTPRDENRIEEVVAAELRREFGDDIDLTESSAFRHIVDAWSQSVNDVQEEQLQEVYESAYLETATGESLDHVVAIQGISRQEAQRATGVVSFTRSDPAPTDYPIPQGTNVQTGGANPVVFETTEQTTLENGDTRTDANIQSVEGGVMGNVAAGSITVIPAGIAGVESVTNQTPTGDSDYTDLNNESYQTGQSRETDEQLRDRAQAVVSEGSVATREAIYSALLNNIPEVQSVSVFDNNTTNDYRDQGGLPPVSFEAVIYGGDTQEIAQTIYDEMALTARSYGGANGTRVIETVTASNGQTYQILFSRPFIQQLNIDITVAVDDTYIGSLETKDIIIDYIGGENSSGSILFGTGVGENVIIDTIIDLLVDADGETTGIQGIVNIEITNSVGTSLISTSGIGLEAVTIDNDTVAQTSVDNITVHSIEQ